MSQCFNLVSKISLNFVTCIDHIVIAIIFNIQFSYYNIDYARIFQHCLHITQNTELLVKIKQLYMYMM